MAKAPQAETEVEVPAIPSAAEQGMVPVRMTRRGMCYDAAGRGRHRGIGYQGFMDVNMANYQVKMGYCELMETVDAPVTEIPAEEPEEATEDAAPFD